MPKLHRIYSYSQPLIAYIWESFYDQGYSEDFLLIWEFWLIVVLTEQSDFNLELLIMCCVGFSGLVGV